MRKVHENQVRLKLNDTYQLLTHADVNLLRDNKDAANKNTETLMDTSKKVGLQVKVEKTKYMLPSRNQNAGQNHDINTVNRLFENVAKFKSLETTATNQNLIQEEIKGKLNSGNTANQSRSFCLLVCCPKM
jgi:hypothetical protein